MRERGRGKEGGIESGKEREAYDRLDALLFEISKYQRAVLIGLGTDRTVKGEDIGEMHLHRLGLAPRIVHLDLTRLISQIIITNMIIINNKNNFQKKNIYL